MALSRLSVEDFSNITSLAIGLKDTNDKPAWVRKNS